MVKLSRFAHTLNLNEYVALWHSLRLKPIFLTQKVYADLLDGNCEKKILQELINKKIVLSREGEDDEILGWLRSKAPQPAISLCYFILSERCNLACKYCFLGNASKKRELFSATDMSKETAEKAIHFFVKQLELSGIDFLQESPQLLFYGGEPLMNFEVLEYTANKITKLKKTTPVLKNIKMTVITNGTLLSEELIAKLNDLGVMISVSIDGFSEECNEMRVDVLGKPIYEKILSVFETCKRLAVIPSLSVTLSEKTIEDLSGLLRLIENYGIRGLGFNILMCSNDYRPSSEYYADASQFVIDSFKKLRRLGVYEDRIMRKLNSFANAQVYFSDCGATGGGQLVFSPDGRVGICHGLLAEKENFVTTVDDKAFAAKNHPLWQEWASMIPIKNDECLDCEALGICGGGCPVSARYACFEKGLQCIDARQCIHAKSALRFLVEDLYDNVAKTTSAK